MPDLIIHTERKSTHATASFGGKEYDVLVGKNGPIDAEDKREGDGCTPLGRLNILYGLYRADRVAKPGTNLSWRPLTPYDRWCERVDDPLYNQLIPVDYPFPVEGDGMWREDARWNFTLVLNWNMPAVPGRGSGILLHVRREESVSFGCVLMHEADIREIAPQLSYGDAVDIRLA